MPDLLSAIFSQPEQGFGLVPGAGRIQHLTRLMGRARALEVLLSADDYNADLAERYGWIRSLSTAWPKAGTPAIRCPSDLTNLPGAAAGTARLIVSIDTKAWDLFDDLSSAPGKSGR
jgi:enoyl-CoA hydratase/carnithine racemase